MNDHAQDIKERLWHGLVPAVPVPFRKNGKIDEFALEGYAEWMAGQPIAGVAAWAHTGRGLYLNQDQRRLVLSAWNKALPNKVLLAGAGGAATSTDDDSFFASAVQMAQDAAEFGADAILCYAPTRFKDLPEPTRDAAIVRYHTMLAEAGLPLMLFYLYEAAGGIPYSTELLTKLFEIPQVFGIKMATLDSPNDFQRVASLLETDFPEQLLVTGEDCFLGESLTMGANAALIGMAAARTTLQYDLLQSYFDADDDRFEKLSGLVDQLAGSTFITPIEGYIARMLHVLVTDGIISEAAACDPWGPRIALEERAAIDTVLKALDA